MKRYIGLAIAVAMLWAAQALAQPIVDGAVDAAQYGLPLSVQDTRTGYGNGGDNPDPIITGSNFAANGGSEIDQVFAKVSAGRLYVTITGNLEENFNKLNVFIDSKTGGVNKLDGAALPGGLDSFCCGKFAPPKGGNTNNIGALQKMSGLKFDNTTDDPTATASFTADYALIFTNGRETVNPQDPGTPEVPGSKLEFWAVSAHFADLSNTTLGAVGGLGMQLVPRGAPGVLRGPGDYNHNGVVDAADYTNWRDKLGSAVTNGTGADGNANGTIDQVDYDNWKANFGRNTGVSGDAYVPFGNPGNTEALLGQSLPGLSQGQLIDRAYAQGAGGCTGDTGAGCVAKELEFALDVDPSEINVGDPTQSNASAHRNFNNFVDLRMAINNSNLPDGVRGSGGPSYALVPGEDNPTDVMTGIEFSIPLSQIGNPSGPIRLLAFVGNGNYDHVSNQVTGDGVFDSGLGLGANIGNAFYGTSPAGSFNDIPGNQFVTIPNTGGGAAAGVPEPTSLGLVLTWLACSLSLRRRSRG